MFPPVSYSRPWPDERDPDLGMAGLAAALSMLAGLLLGAALGFWAGLWVAAGLS